jgi:hypothetical protein
MSASSIGSTSWSAPVQVILLHGTLSESVEDLRIQTISGLITIDRHYEEDR